MHNYCQETSVLY